MTAITKSLWGIDELGTEIHRFRLTNSVGSSATITNWGAAITSIDMPDSRGCFSNVVLNYPSVDKYIHDECFLGVMVGPFSNRIAQGRFKLQGQVVQLPINETGHHLHSEAVGIHKKNWSAKIAYTEGRQTLILNTLLLDGEGGYPGKRMIEVSYYLSDENTLELRARATTTRDTIINIANHAYFNLSGGEATSIEHHLLSLNGDKFLPVDACQIPTGELRSVSKTPFDFINAKTIGADIRSGDRQIKFGSGFDHCWVLNKPADTTFASAATLCDPHSGRKLEVFTDQPGVQFYSGNHLEIGGFNKRQGLCLETQHFPDSPNHAAFPSTLLLAGQEFSSQTSFTFSLI